MENMFSTFTSGVVWYVVFLFSMVCHEAAHAFAALKLGDRTAYEGGQVTLNPVPHIKREPFGTILMPILSFAVGGWMIGWASAPYNPHWAFRYPKRSAMMAMAGPGANLLLVIVAYIMIRIGMAMEIFFAPAAVNFSKLTAPASQAWEGPAMFLSILFSLNLLLFVFNLIPLPPLDGSGMLPFVLNEDLARKYMEFIRNPTYMFLGLIVAWKLFDYLFSPIYLMAINLLYPGHHYG